MYVHLGVAPGKRIELALFIDAAQVHMLDSMMWLRGYLAAEQMSGAFQMLRSNDLVGSRLVHDNLIGEHAPLSDLMAWNAEFTRMPYRMHSEYLHRLFLNNDLAAGRYTVDGHPLAILNLRAPIVAVGTERDHVAPWKSVYKIWHGARLPCRSAHPPASCACGLVRGVPRASSSPPVHTRLHFPQTCVYFAPSQTN
jgi:poly(3-hydroxyalkanoate) synthetase